jgi:hypothetical protein
MLLPVEEDPIGVTVASKAFALTLDFDMFIYF